MDPIVAPQILVTIDHPDRSSTQDKRTQLIAIADTPHGPMAGTIDGTLADGKVSLKFDMGMFKGSISATLTGDIVSGTWTGQEGSGKVSWKKR